IARGAVLMICCATLASRPVRRAQFREGSREMPALSGKGWEWLSGRALFPIPDLLVSELGARCCLLETGLAIPDEVSESVRPRKTARDQSPRSASTGSTVPALRAGT